MSQLILKNISKEFRTREQTHGTVFSLVTGLVRNEKAATRPALTNISFSAQPGDVIGIIGNNGAGKSTLLKIIAGILGPTNGTVTCTGNVLFLGGVSRGFPPMLSVRDTVYYIGAIAGRTRTEISAQYETIISFAGLEVQQETPVFQLSRGMAHRLAFSITTHLITTGTPDLILFDEVFSKGGDLHFQKKALKKLKTYITHGSIVLLVSHNLGLLKSQCNRMLWIDEHTIKEDGDPNVVIEHYRNSQPT